MPVDQSAYQQNVEQIRQIAEKMGVEVLGQEGWILYSSYTTMVRGDYYFLGINPAGSEEVPPKTVQDSLDGLTEFTEEADKNQFLDIPWNGDQFLPLQKRFKFFFKKEHCGVDPDSVCASNLNFLSRKKEKDSGGWKMKEMANKCWAIHNAIIREIVKPRVIITHGSLSFDFISYKLRGKPIQEQPCNWGNWTWRCSRLEETGQKLIGLPHLSRYAIDSQSRADIVKEIVKQIQSD
jgi:uracil-DNA glycosylase